jgi:hypothetical protein
MELVQASHNLAFILMSFTLAQGTTDNEYGQVANQQHRYILNARVA